MAFLMQGWGQFINQVVLLVLLVIFNSGDGSPPYSKSAAQYTFRLSFALPAIGTLWLLYYRIWKMRNASKKLIEAKSRRNVTGYDVNSLRYCVKHFGGRLIATTLGWFANDVFFYGNKLFQGQFIKIISSNPNSLMTSYSWNLVNITVSLAGYYAAALLIDNKMYGRKMMQQVSSPLAPFPRRTALTSNIQVGFFFCFLMFVIPAFAYKHFTSPAGIHSFQAMYFLSSFFNQFGPNSVTFVSIPSLRYSYHPWLTPSTSSWWLAKCSRRQSVPLHTDCPPALAKLVLFWLPFFTTTSTTRPSFTSFPGLASLVC